MFYVFKPNITYWRGHLIQASFQGQILDFQPSWWLDKPFNKPIPPLTFTVSSAAPKPDYLFVGTAFNLVSLRMVNLISKTNVKCEAFATEIYDRKTHELLPLEYYALHLLELFPVLDKNRSIYDDNSSYIEKLVLTKSGIEVVPPLFRVKEYLSLVLISESLKSAFDSEGITGCSYIPVEEYQAGLEFREILKRDKLS